MTQLWPILLALALPATATGDHDSTAICKTLALALPNLVTFPNTTAYATHNRYWSARQSEVHPACFVAPNTARDVAKAVKLLTAHNAPFTVKAGGHTAFEGGSNIPSGVTLDLVNLNTIDVSADRQTVSVGAGNRWINVSEALDPLGLAVVGGRSSTVGVSGLTLGGGISYFSGLRGWACDNVRNYEVVLASGDVVNASPAVNKDLYWALRGGGGSNFGIVTKFDLVSFEQGDLWASSRIYPGEANRTLIPMMHELLVKGLADDPAAHTYFVIAHAAELGGYAVLSDQFHATHSDLASPPAVFAAFHDDALPALSTNTRMANVSRLSRDIEQAGGLRQTWWDTTVAATATPDLLLDIVPLWEEYVTRLLAAAAADNSTVSPYLIYQAISSNILEAMQVNGGNALGLKPEDGPLMIVQLTLTWTSAAMDELVETSTKELVEKVNALAASRGANSKNGYVYMNYAGKTQDVYAGYGKQNVAKLRRVAKKYDPREKFGKLWKGYFKL
jgi:FAD/FMN-containing dehydrogenase